MASRQGASQWRSLDAKPPRSRAAVLGGHPGRARGRGRCRLRLQPIGRDIRQYRCGPQDKVRHIPQPYRRDQDDDPVRQPAGRVVGDHGGCDGHWKQQHGLGALRHLPGHHQAQPALRRLQPGARDVQRRPRGLEPFTVLVRSPRPSSAGKTAAAVLRPTSTRAQCSGRTGRRASASSPGGSSRPGRGICGPACSRGRGGDHDHGHLCATATGASCGASDPGCQACAVRLAGSSTACSRTTRASATWRQCHVAPTRRTATPYSRLPG